VAQHAGRGVAGEDITLNTDNGGDVGMPGGAAQFVGGIENGDGSAFVSVAPLVAATGRPGRRRGRTDLLGLPVQRRLVVLDLDDQGNVGARRDLEMFF
jgi:hypothetical protein